MDTVGNKVVNIIGKNVDMILDVNKKSTRFILKSKIFLTRKCLFKVLFCNKSIENKILKIFFP